MAHVVFLVAVLGLGNPATHFREVRIARPMPEAECALQGPAIIDQNLRVAALVRSGWRLVMWDCRAGDAI